MFKMEKYKQRIKGVWGKMQKPSKSDVTTNATVEDKNLKGEAIKGQRNEMDKQTTEVKSAVECQVDDDKVQERQDSGCYSDLEEEDADSDEENDNDAFERVKESKMEKEMCDDICSKLNNVKIEGGNKGTNASIDSSCDSKQLADTEICNDSEGKKNVVTNEKISGSKESKEDCVESTNVDKMIKDKTQIDSALKELKKDPVETAKVDGIIKDGTQKDARLKESNEDCVETIEYGDIDDLCELLQKCNSCGRGPVVTKASGYSEISFIKSERRIKDDSNMGIVCSTTGKKGGLKAKVYPRKARDQSKQNLEFLDAELARLESSKRSEVATEVREDAEVKKKDDVDGKKQKLTVIPRGPIKIREDKNDQTPYHRNKVSGLRLSGGQVNIQTTQVLPPLDNQIFSDLSDTLQATQYAQGQNAWSSQSIISMVEPYSKNNAFSSTIDDDFGDMLSPPNNYLTTSSPNPFINVISPPNSVDEALKAIASPYSMFETPQMLSSPYSMENMNVISPSNTLEETLESMISAPSSIEAVSSCISSPYSETLYANINTPPVSIDDSFATLNSMIDEPAECIENDLEDISQIEIARSLLVQDEFKDKDILEIQKIFNVEGTFVNDSPHFGGFVESAPSSILSMNEQMYPDGSFQELLSTQTQHDVEQNCKVEKSDLKMFCCQNEHVTLQMAERYMEEKFEAMPEKVQQAICLRVHTIKDKNLLFSVFDGQLTALKRKPAAECDIDLATLHMICSRLLMEPSTMHKFLEVYPGDLTLVDRAVLTCWQHPLVAPYLIGCVMKALRQHNMQDISIWLSQRDYMTGESVLHRAVSRGQKCANVLAAILNLKSDSGRIFDVNKLNRRGFTPLHMACMNHRRSMVGNDCICHAMTHVLLKHGKASTNVKDINGNTALDFAMASKTCSQHLVPVLKDNSFQQINHRTETSLFPLATYA